MSSQLQNEANRQNAEKSTGPKTEAGKAASSQNARRHGLSSTTIFIPEDRADEFNEMYAAYFDEIKPIGELQLTYFEQLTHAAWNLNIARMLLVRALHEMDDKKIANANRYVAQYERSFAKAHQAVKQEQTDLALRAIPEIEAIADLPISCEIKVIANEANRLAALQERTQRPTHRATILRCIGAAFRPAPPQNEASQADSLDLAA
jgi:hypothetical protein